MANIQFLYSDSQCLSFLRDKEKEKATDREEGGGGGRGGREERNRRLYMVSRR